LSQAISVLLGSRTGEPSTPTARARLAGAPYDVDRVALFEALFARLRVYEVPERPVVAESPVAFANVSFFDAYFSNFIEGTEFEVDEARAIVFDGHIPRLSRSPGRRTRCDHGSTPGQAAGTIQGGTQPRR
jgi:hypothetical protein